MKNLERGSEMKEIQDLERNDIFLTEKLRLHFSRYDMYVEEYKRTASKTRDKNGKAWIRVTKYFSEVHILLHDWMNSEISAKGKKSKDVKEFFGELEKSVSVMDEMIKSLKNLGFAGNERVVFPARYK